MAMYAGRIVEKGTAKDTVFDPVRPYSHGLMGSIPVPEEGTRGTAFTAEPEEAAAGLPFCRALPLCRQLNAAAAARRKNLRRGMQRSLPAEG